MHTGHTACILLGDTNNTRCSALSHTWGESQKLKVDLPRTLNGKFTGAMSSNVSDLSGPNIGPRKETEARSRKAE